MLLFTLYSANHNKIMHMSRQYNCRDMYKISLWSIEHILNQNTTNFDQISNSAEISLLGWVPEPLMTIKCSVVTYGVIRLT